MLIEDLITLGKFLYKEREMFKGKNIRIGSPKMRSLAAIANDATYFFPVAAVESLTPDEIVMIMRAIERTYAMFTRTAFSLIPAIEVENFDTATVRDYLDQFHSNMGVRPDVSFEFQLNSVRDFNGSILNEADRIVLRNDPKTKDSDKPKMVDDLNFYDTNRRVPDNRVVDNRASGDGDQNRKVFTDLDWKKANDLLPSVVQVPIRFISKDTKASHIVDILVNIKAVMHRTTSKAVVENIVTTMTKKTNLLNLVKYVSGEEKSTADFLFGVSQMKEELLKGSNPWLEAFKRRKRLHNIAWGSVKNTFMPIGTICLTMNEVNTLKRTYEIDIFKDAEKIMNEYFLLGLLIADQANEILYTRFDSHNDFQEYPYKTLEREASSQDRTIKDMVKAMGAIR